MEVKTSAHSIAESRRAISSKAVRLSAI